MDEAKSPRVDNAMEQELLDALAPLIEAGEVQIEYENQPFFDLVDAAFPILFSRIDWSKVPGAEMLPPPDERERGSIDLQAHMPAIRAFLGRAARSLGTEAQTEVLVLGDGQMDTVLRLRYGLVLDHLEDLFGLPQHTYIIPADASWCINYTFEDELFFGRSPLASRAP